MPQLSLDVPHQLGQNQAVERLKGRFHEIKQRYAEHLSEFEETWEGDSLNFRFKTFGMKVNGTVTPGPEDVKVRAALPLAALPFKGMIEQQLGDELRRTLA